MRVYHGVSEQVGSGASLSTSGSEKRRTGLIVYSPPRFVIGEEFPTITELWRRGVTTAGHRVRRQIRGYYVAARPWLDLLGEVGIQLNARLHNISHIVLNRTDGFTVHSVLSPTVQAPEKCANRLRPAHLDVLGECLPRAWQCLIGSCELEVIDKDLEE